MVFPTATSLFIQIYKKVAKKAEEPNFVAECMMLAIRCAIWVLVLFAATMGQSTPPRPGPTLWYKSTLYFPSEGNAIDSEVMVDSITNRMLVRYETPSGSNVQLGRYDLKYLIYLFHVDAKPKCVAVYLGDNTPTVRPPTFDGFADAHMEAFVRGNLVKFYEASHNAWKTRLGFSRQGEMKTAIDYGGITRGELRFWQNGSAIPESNFAIPAYCNLTTPPTTRNTVEEGVDGADFFAQQSFIYGMPKKGLNKGLLRSAVYEMERRGLAERWHPRDASLLERPAASVDNRAFASPVRDQGMCGSCWAFSTLGASEIVANLARRRPSNGSRSEWLSPQSIVDCVFNRSEYVDIWAGSRGCFGGSPLLALGFVVLNGVPLDSDYRYEGVSGHECRLNPHMHVERPLSAYRFIVRGSVSTIMAAVEEEGAVVAVISVAPPSFTYYNGGIYNDPACVEGYDHAVVIVGYGSDGGRDYWIIRNSGGVAWGDGGYMKMARGVNRCGVENYIVVPIGRRYSPFKPVV